MNEVVKHLPLQEVMSIAKAFADSGMFPDTRQAAQAIVKIQAGQELGIAPFAAMTGIHIIAGKPVVGAGIIASRIKSSGKYDYKVKEMSNEKCSLDFYEGKNLIGNSSFSIEDARKAGTKNLDKFPKNMLFARAISNGVKWFTPDVFVTSVYTKEEIDGSEEPPKVENAVAEVINEQSTKIEPATVNIVQEIDDKSKADHTPPSASDINTPPETFSIPGHWHAKLEKCKTPEDVDQLGIKFSETINANPELRKLFVKTKDQLKRKTTENV